MKHSRMLTLAALVLAAGLAHSTASADPQSDIGYRGWGPRLGLSSDPDQIHFGAHFDYGHFSRHVRFQPNVELGLSDNESLLALNAEAAYRFSADWDVWTPYLGGGLGVNIKSWDNGRDDDSETDLGVNLLGGIDKGLSNGDRFFVELKVSLNDIPDLKATVGWTFYH